MSFAAEFHVNKPVTIKGTVTKMEWQNPRTSIHIAAKDADGKIAEWAVDPLVSATPSFPRCSAAIGRSFFGNTRRSYTAARAASESTLPSSSLKFICQLGHSPQSH